MMKKLYKPYKQFNMDYGRCYFLHNISNEIELVARAVWTL